MRRARLLPVVALHTLACAACQPGQVTLQSDGMTPFGPLASATWIDLTTGPDLALAPLADDVHLLVLSTAPGYCERFLDVTNDCAAALTELKKTPDLCAEGGDRFADLADALAPLASDGLQQVGIGLHDNTGPLRPPQSDEHRAVASFSGLVAEPVFTLTVMAHRAAPFASLGADWDEGSCGSPRPADADATLRVAEAGALTLDVTGDMVTAALDDTELSDGQRRRGTAAFDAVLTRCPLTITTVEQRDCALMLALGPSPSELVPTPALGDGPLCFEALSAFEDARQRCLALDQTPDVWFNAAACQGAADDGFDNRAFYRCLVDQLTQPDRDAVCEATGSGDAVVQFEDLSIDGEPRGCRELFNATPG